MRLLLLTALVAVFSWPVAAQMVCGPRADIVDRLHTVFGEAKTGQGIAADGSLIELFTGKNGWTVLATQPGRPPCVVAVGQRGTGWQRIEPVKGKGT